MMELYWCLLLGHLLYDFHWQGEFIGVGKSKYNFLLVIHCLTYSTLMVCIFNYFGYYKQYDFFLFLYLFSTHYIIDLWKCRGGWKVKELGFEMAIMVDQYLHLLSFIPVIYFMYGIWGR